MVTKRGGKGPVAAGTPTAMGNEVPEALQAVTLKAMATDRNKRYASVEAFAGDIERYQNGFATDAEQAGIGTKLYLFVKRHRAISALVVLSLLGAAAFTGRLAVSERIALRHAMEAEKSAVAARISEATAQLALAESAERDSDAEKMDRLLAAIPEDLRGPDWHYFQRRLSPETLLLDSPDSWDFVAIIASTLREHTFLTVNTKGQVRSVNTETGKATDLFKINASQWLALSPDERHLAVSLNNQGKNNSTITIYNARSGAVVKRFETPRFHSHRPVSHVNIAFNQDGSLLLCNFGGQPHVFEVHSGKLIWKYENRSAAVFIQKPETLRVTSLTEGAMDVNVLTGNVTNILPAGKFWIAGSDPFTNACFDEKFSRLFAFSTRDVLSGIRLNAPKEISSMLFGLPLPFQTYGSKAGFSSFLDSIVTLSKTGDWSLTLRLWETTTGKVTAAYPLLAKKAGPWNLAVHPISNEIVVSQGSKLRIFKINAKKPEMSVMANIGTGISAQAFSFLASEKRIAFLWNSMLCVRDFSDNDPKNILWRHSLPFHASTNLKVSRDGRVAAVNDISKMNAQYFRWNGSEMQPWKTPAVPASYDLLLDTFGDRIWSLGKVHWIANGALQSTLDYQQLKRAAGISTRDWVGSDHAVEIVTTSSGNDEAKEDSQGRALVLWDLRTGKNSRQVSARDAVGVAVSPDGNHIAEAGADMRVRIRNAWTLSEEQSFRAHDQPLTSIVWHPSGRYLVTGSNDWFVRVWDTDQFRIMDEFRVLESQPQKLMLNPSGRILGVCKESKVDLFRPALFQ